MPDPSKGMQADGLGPPILFFLRRRYYIAFMAFFGYVVSSSTRVNLSVAIIYMVRPNNITLSNGTIIEQTEFEWSDQTQGLILAAFFYGYIVTQMPGGYLGGIIGGNHVLNIGVAGSGLLSFIGPVCVKYSVPATIAMRVLCGLLQGVTVPAVNSLWARWAPPLERTILSTIAISGNFFSSLIIMPICSAIGDNLGWEWMFYIFGAASIVWCLIWYFTVFAGPEKDRFIKASEREYIEAAIGERTDKKPIHPWKKLFSSMPVGAIVVSQTGHNWGYYTLLLYGPKYYTETLKYDVSDSTLYTGCAFSIIGLLMQVFGYISDTIRQSGRMKTVGVRKLFCCGGFAIQMIMILSLAFVTDPLLCITFSVLAIGLGGITCSGFNVNSLDIAAPHAAIIAAIANTSATLPGMFTPIVACFFLTDSAHDIKSWMWIWIICAIVYFLSGLFFLIFAVGVKQSWVHTPEEE